MTWTYDNSYQLRREQRSGANKYDITHTYDAAGNRLTRLDRDYIPTPIPAARTTYAYDEANQLETCKATGNVTTFAYDADRNLFTKDDQAAGVTAPTRPPSVQHAHSGKVRSTVSPKTASEVLAQACGNP